MFIVPNQGEEFINMQRAKKYLFFRVTVTIYKITLQESVT